MRNPALILIFVLIIPAVIAEKGKYYEKEKICKELKTFGIEKFREMVTVLYSQKFPNNKFEEVNGVVDDMTKLTEKCCKDDASPDCYDKGVKSCRSNDTSWTMVWGNTKSLNNVSNDGTYDGTYDVKAVKRSHL